MARPRTAGVLRFCNNVYYVRMREHARYWVTKLAQHSFTRTRLTKAIAMEHLTVQEVATLPEDIVQSFIGNLLNYQYILDKRFCPHGSPS